MKGIVFNILQKMVCETSGMEAWETLLERTNTVTKQGAFLGPQTYPDGDLMALVGTASQMLGTPPDELVRAFGRYMFPHLIALHPDFIKPHMTAKDFLASVDRVIHVEVRKLHSGTVLPRFSYEDPAPDRLIMIYESERKLCDLTVGLIQGVSAHFHERIDIDEERCVKRGDGACRFHLTFASRSEG